jgi:hypothetical protein
MITLTRNTPALPPGNYAVTDNYVQFQPHGSTALSPGGGSYSFQVPRIAARNENDLDGRTYTIMVVATDTVGRPADRLLFINVDCTEPLLRSRNRIERSVLSDERNRDDSPFLLDQPAFLLPRVEGPLPKIFLDFAKRGMARTEVHRHFLLRRTEL